MARQPKPPAKKPVPKRKTAPRKKPAVPLRKMTTAEITEIENLAPVMAKSDLADYFGVSEDDFTAMEKRDKRIDAAFTRGKAKGRANALKNLYDAGKKGNVKATQTYLNLTGENIEKTDKRIGNQYWRSRSSHGRNPIFKTPDQLMSACEEYFDYVEDNPLKSAKPHVVDGKIVYSETAVMRAMTIKDLCRFLDIDHKTWINYRNHVNAKGVKDFFQVVTRVEDIIYTQKLTGAAGGMLNANIIARDLGLKDQSEVTGAGGGPVVHEHRTWRQVLRDEKEQTDG